MPLEDSDFKEISAYSAAIVSAASEHGFEELLLMPTLKQCNSPGNAGEVEVECVYFCY